MNKKYHLFDDGNYIEFSINNNYKTFAFQTIPSNAIKYDLSSNYEEQKIITKSRIPIFHPTSHGLLFWQFLMVIIILLYFFYIPLKIAFTDDLNDLNPNNNQAINSFLIFSIIVLAFDLLISFNTGYVENGQVILDRQQITKHYLNLEFELDLIGVMSLILSYVLDLDIIRLLFYLRTYYIIRFDNKIDHQLLLKKKVKGAYLLLKLILVMLFVAHIMACIFYGISYSELMKDDNGIYPYIDTWIIYNNYVEFDDQIQTSKLFSRYIVSFYWAITTVSTNGYGDITPKNNSEIGWTLLTMIIAGMVFAFNISSIRETIIDLNSAIITEHNLETILNRYMKTKNISLQTQTRIIDYFQYIWKEERNRNPEIEELLISKLAPDLKQQLQYETYINFAQCRIFYYMYFSQDFVYELTQYMQEQPYGPKEELNFLDQQNYQYLLYLNKGEVLIYVDSCYNSINIKTRIDWIYEGQCIGQEAFFLNQLFKYKAQTQSWCNIYRLSRFDFLNVISKYQKDFELFHIVISQRYSDPYEFYTKLDLKCFTCMSESHQADTCDVTHYYPNDLVFKITVKDDKLKREEYQRRIKKQQKSILIQSKIKRIANEFNLRLKKRTLDNSFDESEEEIDYEDEFGEIKSMLVSILKEMNEDIDQNQQIHKTFIPQKPLFDPQERSFCIDLVRDYEHFYPRYNLITIINRIF